MSKKEKIKKFVLEPLSPISNRVEATKNLFGPTITLYLCQMSEQSEELLSTTPFGIVHARLECTINPDDPEDENSFGVRSVEISKNSRKWADLFRQYGASKCKIVKHEEQVSQPFSNTMIAFHKIKFLPAALLLGQWDQIG